MPTVTGINQIDSLLAGSEFRWNKDMPAGTAVDVTFSFAAEVSIYALPDDPEIQGFSQFNAEQQVATRAILTRIASEFNISFTEVDGSASFGQINFYNTDQGETSSGAAFYPFAYEDDDYSGDLFINNAEPENLTNIIPGSRAWSTLVHEIGHTIGLKHPGNYNAGEDASAVQETPFLSATEDHVWYTVMSYTEAPQEQERDWFGILDLGALAYLYGKKAVATGDDTYTYTDAAGENLTLIDDASGTDTIDVSQITLGVTLDMRSGALSSIGRSWEDTLARNSLSIGANVVIENAIGTADDDSITGNDANNQLRGGAGDDTLVGGSGIDTAIFDGSKAAYSITNDAGALTLQGNDGNDNLITIERLQFDDVKIAFDLDANAGTAAKVLGAMAGKESVANQAFVGIALDVLDGGTSYANLMQLALDTVLGPNFTNEAVVNLLFSNLTGAAPSDADISVYAGLIENGTYTPVSLSIAAADHELNASNIDLIGLATTGIEYA